MSSTFDGNRVSPASVVATAAASSRATAHSVVNDEFPKVNLRNREVCARFPRAKVAVRNRREQHLPSSGTHRNASTSVLSSASPLGKTYYNNSFVCTSAVIAIISTSRFSQRRIPLRIRPRDVCAMTRFRVLSRKVILTDDDCAKKSR